MKTPTKYQLKKQIFWLAIISAIAVNIVICQALALYAKNQYIETLKNSNTFYMNYIDSLYEKFRNEQKYQDSLYFNSIKIK